jgi:hypothetical protein
MKRITLTVDETLLVAARKRARVEHTTLNHVFRRWLADYAQAQRQVLQSEDVLSQLRGRLVVGRPLARDKMNAR